MPITDIYLPLSVGFSRDPKIRALLYDHGQDGMLAAYLFLMMCLYCRENLTDGWVPEAEVPVLGYPLSKAECMRLADLLHDARLVVSDAGRKAHALRVASYVKRNGTRADAERRADQRRHAARMRWGVRDAYEVHSGAHSKTDATSARARAESETETKSSSAVDEGDAPRGRARDDDDFSRESNTGDDLDGRIVIMMAAHGIIVDREQARGVRLRILGGRAVADPGRYVAAALATGEGARKWAPAPPASPAGRRQPSALGPAFAARAAEIRAAEAGLVPLDTAERVDAAHRGADAARKLLADRPRPESVPAPVPAAALLHGEALATAQLAEGRAAGAPLTVSDVPSLEDLSEDLGDDPRDEDEDAGYDEPPF